MVRIIGLMGPQGLKFLFWRVFVKLQYMHNRVGICGKIKTNAVNKSIVHLNMITESGKCIYVNCASVGHATAASSECGGAAAGRGQR